jgi:hypothetical protein
VREGRIERVKKVGGRELGNKGGRGARRWIFYTTIMQMVLAAQNNK